MTNTREIVDTVLHEKRGLQEKKPRKVAVFTALPLTPRGLKPDEQFDAITEFNGPPTVCIEIDCEDA